MSALILLLHVDGHPVRPVKFVYEDGRLFEAIEHLGDHLATIGVDDVYWREVAGERAGIILRQREEIKELRTWALLAGWCPPAKELAR
ncbi:MAG: hypothetical protein C0506_06625 [Anaerolinea sp.]|nr:hypothetical protein [Anaerolinea sp.]